MQPDRVGAKCLSQFLKLFSAAVRTVNMNVACQLLNRLECFINRSCSVQVFHVNEKCIHGSSFKKITWS